MPSFPIDTPQSYGEKNYRHIKQTKATVQLWHAMCLQYYIKYKLMSLD